MLKNEIEQGTGRRKADLVLKNGRFVNVFTGEVTAADIAVCGGKIVGFGAYEGEEEIDVSGKIVLPGYIDAHVHIESSQLTPEEFSKLVLPRGTTTVIADPHEITNVCGIEGARYIAEASAGTPLEVHVMLPSCVPATPFETSGAVITGEDTEKYIREDFVFGLGEFMNYPGVVNTDADVLKKLQAAIDAGKVIDGHAPSTGGRELNGYIAAAIRTDHECATPEETREKVSKGMYVHLREGSATRNAALNSQAVDANNMRRFLFCTDDRHAADLVANGHLDNALRVAVRSGLDPVRAVTIATLNAAECYGLPYKGAVAPAYDADLVVVDDLQNFNAKLVVKAGKVVAKEGKPLFTCKKYIPDAVKNTVKIKPVSADDFKIALKGARANVMRIVKGGVVTEKVVREVKSANGDVRLKGTDLLKLAIVERHHRTGNIGKALLEGYGLKGGAIALTISHDSHNIVVLGDDNEDMAAAVAELERIGGGMAVIDKKKAYSYPLDIAGLMSSASAEEFVGASEALLERAYAMGVSRDYEAFMSLSFLGLAVIPELKLTDRGLFDVTKFSFIDIDAE